MVTFIISRPRVVNLPTRGGGSLDSQPTANYAHCRESILHAFCLDTGFIRTGYFLQQHGVYGALLSGILYSLYLDTSHVIIHFETSLSVLLWKRWKTKRVENMYCTIIMAISGSLLVLKSKVHEGGIKTKKCSSYLSYLSRLLKCATLFCPWG